MDMILKIPLENLEPMARRFSRAFSLNCCFWSSMMAIFGSLIQPIFCRKTQFQSCGTWTHEPAGFQVNTSPSNGGRCSLSGSSLCYWDAGITETNVPFVSFLFQRNYLNVSAFQKLDSPDARWFWKHSTVSNLTNANVFLQANMKNKDLRIIQP